MVFVLLSTGLRRAELVNLNWDQLHPQTADALRAAHRARISGVQGKGKIQRDVFLSYDTRVALADYLEQEHTQDAAGMSVSFRMLGAIAQFETEIRAERQIDGIKKAKIEGINSGLNRN